MEWKSATEIVLITNDAMRAKKSSIDTAHIFPNKKFFFENGLEKSSLVAPAFLSLIAIVYPRTMESNAPMRTT